MKRRIIRAPLLASAAILALIGTMAGCTAESDDDPSVSFEEDTLTEANDASQVSLAADRVLALKLDGRPAVGSAWVVDSIDTNVLRLADSDLNAGAGVGGIDKQILRFVGVSKGTTVLKLKYGRPWEDAPEKTYSVKVDVAGSYTGNFQEALPMVAAQLDQDAPMVGLAQHYSLCEQGGCTPIKNQGGCGSCWAFAMTGVFESAIAMKDRVSRDLSEQYLVSCSTHSGGCSYGGANFEYFMDEIPAGETSAGAVYESDFPYTATDEPCNAPHPHHEKITAQQQFRDATVSQMKQAILDHGAVMSLVCADGAFASYRSGIFQGSHCDSVNHAVVLVGWDDNGGDGYWILRNSWGTGWGERGYMKIKWGANGLQKYNFSVTYDGDGGTSCPVELFADSGFRGRSTCLDVGRWDIDKLRATIGNDTLSSVKVAPGYRATLYAARAFLGGTKVLTSDTSSLPGFNDIASSVVVERR